MATVSGTSGALRDAQQLARALGIAGDISDFHTYKARLQTLEGRLAIDRRRATAALNAEIAAAKNAIQVTAQDHARYRQAKDAQAAAEIRGIKEEIKNLTRGGRVITRALNWLRVPWLWWRAFRVRLDRGRFSRALAVVEKEKERDLERLTTTFDDLVQQRTRATEDQVNAMRQFVSSPQLAGACAEVAVVESLRQLPEGFVVLNDLLLSTCESIRFEGQALQTAQIDHLVVGPNGTYVIETKNWSSDFLEKGAYFDPHLQVGRANYLCHRILKASELPDKVRSIIAFVRARPHPKPDNFAKILHIDHIEGYIRYFEPTRKTHDVERIVARMASYGRD